MAWAILLCFLLALPLLHLLLDSFGSLVYGVFDDTETRNGYNGRKLWRETLIALPRTICLHTKNS
ncbi:hypothetical protein BFJ67_g17297 [Fusarium oxysporum f. sp. cepae]|nr:hypothetical protein BFJ67_g17297 [Fusarium oxysporum f. sp. cepae]